jgi:hypothetical protein
MRGSIRIFKFGCSRSIFSPYSVIIQDNSSTATHVLCITTACFSTNLLSFFFCVRAGTGCCCSLGPAWPLHPVHSPTAAASFRLRWRPWYTPDLLPGSATVCLLVRTDQGGVQVRQTHSQDFPLHTGILVVSYIFGPADCSVLVIHVLEFLFHLLFRGLDECCVKLKAESTDQC